MFQVFCAYSYCPEVRNATGYKDRKLNLVPLHPARYPSIFFYRSHSDATTYICRDGNVAVPCNCYLSISYYPEATQNKSDMVSLWILSAHSLFPTPSLLFFWFNSHKSPRFSLEVMPSIPAHQLVTLIQTHSTSSMIPLQCFSYGWPCTESEASAPLF